MVERGAIEWGVRIEGVGDRSAVPDGATNAQLRLATGLPTGDTHGLYRAVLHRLPPRLRFSGDFRTGRSTVGDLEIEILLTDELLGLLCQIRPPRAGTLVERLSPDASIPDYDLATFDAGFLGKEERVVYIGREAIYLGSPGSFGYDYAAVERGVYGTPIQDHDPDAEVFDGEVYEALHVLDDRLVELFWVPKDGGYDDEVVVWAGALRELGTTGEGGTHLLVLSALGQTSLLAGGQISPPSWAALPQPPALPSTLEELLNFGRTARLRLIPAQLPDGGPNPTPASLGLSPSVGDEFLIEAGGSVFAARLDDDDGPTYFYSFDPREPIIGPPLVAEGIAPLTSLVAREIWISDPAWEPGLSDSVPTLLLQLLTSTSHGFNGDYDLGIDFGVGLDHRALDVESFEQVGVRWGVRARATRFIVRQEEGEGEPKALLDRLERELLQPFGLLLTVGEGGLLALVAREEVAVGYDEVAFDDDALVALPSMRMGWERVVDRLVVAFDRDLEGKARSVIPHNQIQQQRRLGPRRDSAIDAGAVAEEAVAFDLALGAIHRGRLAVPTVAFRAHLSYDLAVGRIGAITSDALIGLSAGAPTYGATDVPIVITSKEYDLEAGLIDYQADLLFGIDDGGLGVLGRVSAAARVVSYAAGVITVEANAFVPVEGNGAAYLDTDRFAAGDKVRLLDQYGAVRDSALTVGAVGATSLTINSPPAGWGASPPVAGDLVIFDVYDSVVARQATTDAFIAGSDGTVGTAEAPGYRWQG